MLLCSLAIIICLLSLWLVYMITRKYNYKCDAVRSVCNGMLLFLLYALFDKIISRVILFESSTLRADPRLAVDGATSALAAVAAVRMKGLL